MWPWPIHEDHDIDKLQYTAWKTVHSFWEDFLKNIKKINQFNLFPLEIGHGVMDFQFNQLETHIFIIILLCGCSSDWGEKVDNILRSDRQTNSRQQVITTKLSVSVSSKLRKSHLSLQLKWAENYLYHGWMMRTLCKNHLLKKTNIFYTFQFIYLFFAMKRHLRVKCILCIKLFSFLHHIFQSDNL